MRLGDDPGCRSIKLVLLIPFDSYAKIGSTLMGDVDGDYPAVLLLRKRVSLVWTASVKHTLGYYEC